MTTYKEEFQTALEFSETQKMYDETYTTKETIYVEEWLMYDLSAKIAELFTKESYMKFMGDAQSSSRLHNTFKPIVDKLLNTNAVLTTGYVKVANDAHEVEEFGKFTQADAALALKEGKLPEKLHAWLTLDSGEILDLAFMTIYGLIYNEDSLLGSILANKPENLSGGMEYHPIFVGDAIYSTCGFDFRIDFTKYEATEEEE